MMDIINKLKHDVAVTQNVAERFVRGERVRVISDWHGPNRISSGKSLKGREFIVMGISLDPHGGEASLMLARLSKQNEYFGSIWLNEVEFVEQEDLNVRAVIDEEKARRKREATLAEARIVHGSANRSAQRVAKQKRMDEQAGSRPAWNPRPPGYEHVPDDGWWPNKWPDM